MYVDVHTHLTHEKFDPDRDQVIQRAIHAGITAIVVNGLEPRSNRAILEMAAAHEEIKPALGIYPVDAVNDRLPSDLPFAVEPFDVDEEIKFIRQQALQGSIAAIGECGLDGHWLPKNTYARQEEVFESLIEIAKASNLPLIIHTRKLEQRSMDILAHHQFGRVNFHCYGGRTKKAAEAAEKHGWWFSIPANARTNQAFTKMLKILPEDKILTETDAPFLAPTRGERNEPAHVVGTIQYLAELKGWSVDEAKQRVWDNYLALFKPKAF